MFSKTFFKLPLAIVCVLIGGNVALSQSEYRPVVGEPHDDFVFATVGDRKPVALSDYRGKKVLLVHFASW